MVDVVSAAVRSRMMSGIRAKDTRPEMLVRRGLHRRGFRFRLHDQMLPGRPDLVFPRYHAAIFVHGCFWHGHDCDLFKWPSTRPQFWRQKIGRNRAMDERVRAELLGRGWRVGVVWECATKGRLRRDIGEVSDILERWLLSGRKQIEVRGA